VKRLLPLLLIVTVFSLGTATAPAFAQDPCRDAQGNEICPHYNSFDDRVNYLDPIATMTAFCQDGGALDVWIINGYDGQYLYTAAAQTISAGLGQAIATGQAVLVGDIASLQVWALPTNQLMLHDGRTGYEFKFSPALCHITASSYTAPVVVNTPTAITAPSNVPVATVAPTQVAAMPYDGTVRTTTRLIFRSLPDMTTGKVILTLPINTALTVIARSVDNQWLYIKHQGKHGWVFADYTNIPSSVKMKLPIGIVK
jgi:hypothetical protein